MDGSERFEQLIAFIGSQLPKPVDARDGGDGSIIFTGGDPSEVIVQLTQSSVLVAEFAAVWDPPDTFRIKPRPIADLQWPNLGETALMNALSALINGTREARLAKYGICAECGAHTPPEQMGADDVCRGCTGPSHGTIH